MSLFQQEVIARVRKEFVNQAFVCSLPCELSFARFCLDLVPANYFAFLNKAKALENATIGPSILLAVPGRMETFPNMTSDIIQGQINAFGESHLGSLGDDPRVQVRKPTFFEAVYLDWVHLREKQQGLFGNFAIRTGSFLKEINPHNNRGGYQLIEDPQEISFRLKQNGQHPLLNIIVGRPYQNQGLIVDVVLPRGEFPYLYCPPVIVVTEG